MEILARAHQEQRVCVTLDKDFGELAIVRGHPHCGIIRLVNQSGTAQAEICLRIIAQYSKELEGLSRPTQAHPAIGIPYVIDNQIYRLADVLNRLLAGHPGRSVDVATAYFTVAAFAILGNSMPSATFASSSAPSRTKPSRLRRPLCGSWRT